MLLSKLWFLDRRFKYAEHEMAYVQSKAKSSLISLVCSMAICMLVVGVKVLPLSPNQGLGVFLPPVCFLAVCVVIEVTAVLRLSCASMCCIGHEFLWLLAVIALSLFILFVDLLNPLTLDLRERMQVTAVTVVGVSTMSPMRFHYLCLALLIITSSRCAGYYVLDVPIPLMTSVLQSLMVVQLLMAAWWIETYERKDWRQACQLKEVRAELSGVADVAAGMSALANRLCDLVVRLGSDQRVCDREVAHLSFFGRNIYGEFFHSLLPPEDKQRFKKTLQLASSSQVSQLIPVTLLCSGHPVQGHVLIVDTGSDPHRYLVGVLAEMPLNEAKDGGDVPGVRLDGAYTAAQSAGVDAQTAVTAPSTRFDTTASGEAFKKLNLSHLLELGAAEHWVLDRWHLRVGNPTRILGVGGFGLVLAAQLHGKCVAVKVPRKRDNNQPLRDLCNELRVLRHVRHTNLVNFIGAVIDADKKEIALVYEFLNGVELGSYVRRLGPPTRPLGSYCLMVDVCSALQYLHAHDPPILHGDLKSSNVMVETALSRPRAKMIDFGLSLFQTKSAKVVGFTRSWAAPEVFIKGKCPLPSSDVFSMGWLLHFVLTGQSPHGNLRGAECNAAVKEMARTGYIKPLLWPVDGNFAQGAPGLCNRCLQNDPAARPSISEVRSTIAGWITEDGICEAGFEICSTTLPTTAFRSTRLLSVAEDASLDTRSHLEAKVCMGQVPTVQSSALMRQEEVVWETFGQDSSFWDQFEDPASIQLAVSAVASDIYSCAAHAPNTVDFGCVDLRVVDPTNKALKAQSTSIATRLKVNFPGVAGVPRDEYVVTLQLYTPSVPRRESL